MLIANPRAVRSVYPANLEAILNIEKAAESRTWLHYWDKIAVPPTPLHQLPQLAAKVGVASISVKDEAERSELGSFKALGAPIALARLVLRQWPMENLSPQALFAGYYRSLLAGFTVISATDGNHGKGLAAAAQSMGCRCVIVLHANVSKEREAAIAAYGAEIMRVSGNYDESVTEAARLAEENGWHVVSDTSYEGYQAIPRDVMQGYGTIAAEIIEQTSATPKRPYYTHVFLQGGVGGLAAGIISYFWEYHGHMRPTFVVVEPEQADCLLQSAIAGQASKATGSVDSVMAGLACGEASSLAWKFLHGSVDYFISIPDSVIADSMLTLANGGALDCPIVAGESGVAGLAGLVAISKDGILADEIGLDRTSRVLVINTEGATAPGTYRELVGETSESVLRRKAAWSANSVA